MTHSLHRLGTPESLRNDYVVLCMPSSGLNSAGSEPKLREFLKLALKYDPVNIGDSKRGSMFSLKSKNDVIDNVKDNIVVHSVFDSKENLIGFIKELTRADLGLSVVVSGLFGEVEDCCRKTGTVPHTVVQSLGVWGNAGRLPERTLMEITTMCGHGLVSVNLVRDLVSKINRKRMSIEKAAEMLAKPCICGIFNPKRAEEILGRLTDASV